MRASYLIFLLVFIPVFSKAQNDKVQDCSPLCGADFNKVYALRCPTVGYVASLNNMTITAAASCYHDRR